MTDADFRRLEKKMDQILTNQEMIKAAMGLSDKSRSTPAEREAWADDVILQFRKKQTKRGHEREESQRAE